MNLLHHKHAVITGGSDGIGFGIAQSFVANGCSVLLIGRDIKKLEAAKTQLTTGNEAAVYVLPADLSDPTQLDTLVPQILRLFPKVDILVNNAGIGKFVPFSETDAALLELHLNLNIKTPYFLTQQLLGALKASKGNIINISSYFAHRMLPGRTTTAYSLTKGAINSFTKSLAFELGSVGVRVNAIAPGSIETPQLNRNLDAMSPDQQDAFHQMVKTIYPLGSIGEAEDIAQAAVFLASDQAKWVTGTIMAVDGGLTTN